MRTFGKLIKEIRIAKRMTLMEVADSVGISVAYLSNIEWGRRSPPDAEKIKAIAHVLGASVRELNQLAKQDHLEAGLLSNLQSLPKQQQDTMLLLARKSDDQAMWDRIFEAVKDE